jgi:hypothetical protein
MGEINWEQRRFEVAKEVMTSRILGCSNINYINIDEIAKFSVEYADALINELKKTDT